MHTGHRVLTLGTCPDAAAPMAGGATLLPRYVPATRTDLREENVRGRGEGGARWHRHSRCVYRDVAPHGRHTLPGRGGQQAEDDVERDHVHEERLVTYG